MKFFIAIALIAAVASAADVKRPTPLPSLGGGIAGAVIAPPAVVNPSPVVITPGPVASSPSASLVQLIVNINQAAGESAPIVGEIHPMPVQVVDSAPITVEPVQVAEVAPTPVQVVEVAPTPVQVVETAPVAIEPVIIGTPVLPSPAVVLPEELN